MIIPPARNGENHDGRHDALHPKIGLIAAAKQQRRNQERCDQADPSATGSDDGMTLPLTGVIQQAASAGIPGGNTG